MVKQGSEGAALIEEVIFQKTLTMIPRTCCHGDHYFDFLEMLKYFLKSQRLAAAGGVEHIDIEVDAEAITKLMASKFPGST